jgi:hypothetical protein
VTLRGCDPASVFVPYCFQHVILESPGHIPVTGVSLDSMSIVYDTLGDVSGDLLEVSLLKSHLALMNRKNVRFKHKLVTC